jgi:hypothetical protein
LDRNALVAGIGRRLVADPAVSDGDWSGYALIVRYGQGAIARRLSGFRYDGSGAAVAATPRDPGIAEAFDALRDVTRLPGREPWQACVLRIRRADGHIGLEFEYDAPERWDITPDTMVDVVARARPAPDLPG